VLPAEIAEKAAQINLDREYRTSKKDGGIRKPHLVWISLDYVSPKMDDTVKGDVGLYGFVEANYAGDDILVFMRDLELRADRVNEAAI
jgi:hypothetical protein